MLYAKFNTSNWSTEPPQPLESNQNPTENDLWINNLDISGEKNWPYFWGQDAPEAGQ